MKEANKQFRVIIVGAGFAGIQAAKELSRSSAQVTLIDRKNHHAFQPLLYQVAMAGLSPAQIAVPVRLVLREAKNVHVLLGEVTAFDLSRKVVRLGELEFEYDFLIVATGATHTYFGHTEWEDHAPGLKTVEDALEIRRRVLLAFELAERDALTTGKHPPLNFVVIGGGPTGVELAGAIADISRRVMQREFRAIEPGQSKVLLLEGGPRILPTFPPELSICAEEQLRDLGVEVRTNTFVTDIGPNSVTTPSGHISASVILWAAGVAASPLGRMLGAPVDRAGRVLVEPNLSLPGHQEVFVAGDLASVAMDAEGKPATVPGLAPAALQMGKFAARQIMRTAAGKPSEEFQYRHRGNLATIGISKAVADFGQLRFSGHFAWLTWLCVHLFFLIGFRNRLSVLWEWAWSYITANHSARLITHTEQIGKHFSTSRRRVPNVAENP